MGRSTNTAVVKYALTVWHGDNLDLETDAPPCVLYVERYEGFNEGECEDDAPRGALADGWVVDEEYEDDSDVWFTHLRFQDTEIRVKYVNEDPYANGGGICATFCADRKDDLVRFCEDHGFDLKDISDKPYAVQQTM